MGSSGSPFFALTGSKPTTRFCTMVMEDNVQVEGLSERRKEIEQLVTSNPAMKREIQAIIRKCINEARKNVVKDAQGVLENDPRHAYKAVRNSVYKQIFGGQINILPSGHRGAATGITLPGNLTKTHTSEVATVEA